MKRKHHPNLLHPLLAYTNLNDFHFSNNFKVKQRQIHIAELLGTGISSKCKQSII